MKECPREKADGASLEQEHIEPARELLHESAAQACVKGKRVNRAGSFRRRMAVRQTGRKMQAQLIRVVPPGNPVPCFMTGTEDVPAFYFTEKRRREDGKGKKTGTVDHFQG